MYQLELLALKSEGLQIGEKWGENAFMYSVPANLYEVSLQGSRSLGW
jgi:hypothetical protein